MAITKAKSEGGHKRGHSNMSHYDCTAEIKRGARKQRRLEAKKQCRDYENQNTIRTAE